jgi:probable rRNA maturation factor
MNDGPKPGTAPSGISEIAAIVALDDHDGLEIFAANEQTDLPIDIDRWQALARAVLIDEGVVGDVEVSLMFVDEPSISALNLQFMGKEGPTDVLSFPIDEEASPRNGSPNAPHPSPLDDDEDDDDQPMMLGDVLICPVVAARNAVENIHEDPVVHDGSLEDELALLVVHGLLHLMGMDHMVDSEAEEMEAREQVLLSRHYRARPLPEVVAATSRASETNADGASSS